VANGATITVDSETMTVSAGGGTCLTSATYTVTRAAPVAHSGTTATTGTGQVPTCVSVNVATAVPSGTVMTIDSEQMQITACSPNCTSTGVVTYTVTRGFGGTTTASHSSGAPVTRETGVSIPVSITGPAPTAVTGDVIKIDSEQMLVTACSPNCTPPTSYTVTRGYGGTTPATHISVSTVKRSVTTTDISATLTVPLTGSLPASVTVDSEQMVVNTCNGTPTCNVGTNTLNVTRATGGTTLAAHNSGADIRRLWAPTSYTVNGVARTWDWAAFNSPPAQTGWIGGGFLVRLRDVVETLTVSSGPGAVVPTYTRSGYLDYWDGTGYSTTTLSAAAAASVDIPALKWATGTTATMCQGAEAATTPIGTAPASTAYPLIVPAGTAPVPATSNPIVSAAASGSTNMLPPSMYLRMSNGGGCDQGNPASSRVAYLNVAPNTGVSTASATYSQVTVGG